MARKTRSKPEVVGEATVLIIGLGLIAPNFLDLGLDRDATGWMAFAGLICAGFGAIGIAKTVLQSRRLPKQQIMGLAEERQGILTLSEISTTLDLDPSVVQRALKQLSKAGVATQRWQEFRKNIWEFPDYMKLPISESIELAKSKGGRLTLDDLVASGHTANTARQTLDTLSQKGLAQPDPASDQSALIVTTQ